ncbi:MAG: copper chaperone PCu(A)C [Actinobacteria bacterium]|nr:MAG: copper chaperone PCu(A)C [Actinomycetota bacterium]
MRRIPAAMILAATATATATMLAGCSSGSTSADGGAGSASPSATTTSSGSASASTSPSASSSAACPLSVSDAWVKAADSGMSAAFGVVRNTSDAEVSITAAASPVSTMTQLHQTTMVDGSATMSEVSQLAVPASGDLTLAPGGNHIMFMGLTSPVQAGEDVPITLTCAGGGTIAFTAQARSYDGANESYEASTPAGM